MVETLFFFCHQAYLLGDLEKTRDYYEMLKEEFREKGDPEALRRDQLLELKKIRNALQTGSIHRATWIDEPPVSIPSESTDFSEKTMVSHIHKHCFKKLAELLQDDIYLYNLEHPCPPYGKVDMVYMGKETFYPVEVKAGMAQHAILGQVFKYDLYCKLRLNLKQYRNVQAVTICNGYKDFVLSELKRAEVIPLLIQYTSGGVMTLKRV